MELLFAHEDGSQLLEEAPAASSAVSEIKPVDERDEKYLADVSANANALDKQRWAVVVPEGPGGERLRALIEPLAARRAEEQQADVLTIQVPAGMDAQSAMVWKKDVYPRHYDHKEHRRPRYLCILGDMDGVSLETQQALALDGLPGRLVCRDEPGYEAYVAKVLRWEAAPSAQSWARSLFYTVHDGTSATTSGYHKLVEPCVEYCRALASEEPLQFPAASINDGGSQDRPDPSELLDLVSGSEPTVLFSLSHGMGPPRRRRWTPDQARERQGAMSFGTGDPIMPGDIAKASFLSEGLWFYFACFGAGTPGQSAYHHWLQMLKQSGADGLGNINSVLAGLDQQGGFTSGIAQAALGNENGPLGIIGHVDLAWSYSFEELQVGRDKTIRGVNRSHHYVDLLAKLVKGERIGVSTLNLQQTMATLSSQLNQRYDHYQMRGTALEDISIEERTALGHLWMQRQDLLGYVILGDPAVRLPLANERRSSRRRHRDRLGMSLSGGSPRRRSMEMNDKRSSAGQLGRIEETILALATGQCSASDAADALSIGRNQVRQWEEAYRSAGCRALAELIDNG